MQKLQMSRSVLMVAFVIVGVVIALVEVFVMADNAALLLTLTFWVAIAQGCIALVAAAELSRAKWIEPLKHQLLSAYPVIWFLSLLFLILGLKLDIYPWAAHPDTWLNQSFFVGRNFALLAISGLVAWGFTRASVRGSQNKSTYAVLYILTFVTCQSLVAFDWVMTLDYPWFSTLFGGYFFVESFYAGIALAGLVGLDALRSANSDDKKILRKSVRDSAVLLFGFALFWAGLFFSQYLVIWYGNIPEETGYLVKRLADPVLGKMAPIILLALFVVPFLGLISERAKFQPKTVRFMSLLVLAGILLERLFFLMPVVPLNAVLVIVEFAAVGVLFTATLASRESFMPQ